MQGVLQHVLQLGQHHADKWSCKKKKKEKEPMLLFSQKKNRDIQEISMWKEFWSS